MIGSPPLEERRIVVDPQPLNDKPYSAMTGSEKLAFIGKACIFFLSGGFIYPTLWID